MASCRRVGDDFCTGVLGRVNAQVVAAVAARTAADMNFIFVVVCVLLFLMQCYLCYVSLLQFQFLFNNSFEFSYDNLY